MRSAAFAASRTDTTRPGTSAGLFYVYVAAFHLLWIFWPYVLYPRLTAALNARSLSYAVVQLTIRVLFWVAPVWLYLRYVDGVEPLAYLKLKHNVPRGFVAALVLTMVNVLGMLLRFGLPHPSLSRVTWNSVLGTSLLVGVVEEIPYRGFMLQKLAERMPFWRANVITSALFLAIHLPGWMALHTFRTGSAITIFVFGLVMAVVFRFAGSLWAPIVTHSANDCLSFVVFGL
jgi:membrane protease YdiL (CAAX protease family)